jgi:hypothetical protein
MIWVQNQLVGAHEGQQMTLECHSEAYPKSINYWTREKGDIIAQGEYNSVLFIGDADCVRVLGRPILDKTDMMHILPNFQLPLSFIFYNKKWIGLCFDHVLFNFITTSQIRINKQHFQTHS